MSEIVPDLGCSNNHVHIPTEQIGNIELYISLSRNPIVSRYVEIVIMKHENNVVLVAGFIPVNSAILKNSSSAIYVSNPIAIVKNHPPNKTTTNPNNPISKPLRTLIFDF